MHDRDELEEFPEVPDSLCYLNNPVNPLDLADMMLSDELGADIPDHLELEEAFRLSLIGRVIGAQVCAVI